MLTNEEKENFVNALEIAGVDNWTWYSESIGDLTDEERNDPVALYDAFDASGVDNWEGYSYAYDYYQENYGDPDEDEEAIQSEPEPEPEPELEIISASELRLKNIVGEDNFDEVNKTFWKYSTNPKAFKATQQYIAKHGGTIEDMRMKLIDNVYGKNA